MVRKLRDGLAKMSRDARYILEMSFAASAAVAASALVLFSYCGGFHMDTRWIFYCAEAFYRMPPILLLVGLIGAACAEDINRTK